MKEADWDRFVGEIIDRMQSPIPAWLWLRTQEVAKGHRIMPPGSVSWFPAADWHENDCISVTKDGEVRIVAVYAQRPGSGAFRRLIDGITLAGLVPVVVCPFPVMELILTNWGWRQSHVGDSFETREDQWRPPDASDPR